MRPKKRVVYHTVVLLRSNIIDHCLWALPDAAEFLVAPLTLSWFQGVCPNPKSPRDDHLPTTYATYPASLEMSESKHPIGLFLAKLNNSHPLLVEVGLETQWRVTELR
ncbi:hypothetical protein J6590_093001 [Homalodisca vitripennis]|nr:hypothetical protein J6590_093001 [Homalodisca vitripennis]